MGEIKLKIKVGKYFYFSENDLMESSSEKLSKGLYRIDEILYNHCPTIGGNKHTSAYTWVISHNILSGEKCEFAEFSYRHEICIPSNREYNLDILFEDE